VHEFEQRLDAGSLSLDPAELEEANAALIRVKDAVWAIRCDRLRTAQAVEGLAAGTTGRAALAAFASVQVALSGLDRLEVRGRDSAGIHLLVTGHGLDLAAGDVQAMLAARSDPLFTSRAAATPDGHLSLVYKAAAEIGELG